MDTNFNSAVVINNEYDYSNILPTIDIISYLVQFCDQMNKQLTKLVSDDEEKNKQFKPEYKEYMYKKSYHQNLEVYIVEKGYNNITCNDFETFMSAVNAGNLNHVSSVSIKLCLNFSRGSGNNLFDHENFFNIIFKPYEITFARKSNYNDLSMDQIENQINEIFKKFPVANCVFCTK